MAEKHHTAWNRARDWLPAAAWPALLLLVCIGFFWKLVLTDQYTWLDSPDIAYQVLPSYQLQAGEWHSGLMPLWDLYRGQPLVGQPDSGAAYPLNWLLFLAPLRNGWIRQAYLHWYFVLIHCQAALFCYWLCRDLNRSQPASLLSAIAFGLGGFIGASSSPAMLNAAAWAPLVLLFFLRAMRGYHPVASAACSGGFLGFAVLSGNLQVPLLMLVVILFTWLYLRPSQLKLFLICSVSLILVGSLQLLPAYTYRTLTIHPPETQILVGLVTLTLALVGIFASWEDRIARLLAAIALAGLIPGAAFILHFGLCVLIAYGIDDYRSLNGAIKKAVIILLCGISAAAALLIWILHTTKTPTDPRLGMVVLIGFLLASILNAWDHARISSRTALTAVALVLLLELGNITTYSYQAQAEAKSLLPNLSEHSDIALFLSHHIGPVRVEVDPHDIPYNFGDWYGIDQLGTVANTGEAMLYATNFQLARSPKRPDQVEVFTGRSGVKVYENPAALPRLRIAHDETCQATEPVSLISRRSGHVTLQADLKCRGMVIDAESLSPDWIATVDGKPSPLHNADSFLRGVIVEPGSHRIELRYRPKSVYWGAALSAIGLIGAFLTYGCGVRACRGSCFSGRD